MRSACQRGPEGLGGRGEIVNADLDSIGDGIIICDVRTFLKHVILTDRMFMEARPSANCQLVHIVLLHTKQLDSTRAVLSDVLFFVRHLQS
jgi:hypothetical protein